MTPAQRRLWRAKEKYALTQFAGDMPLREARALWRAQAKLGMAEQAVRGATYALQAQEPLKSASVRGRLKRAERAVAKARAAVETEAASEPLEVAQQASDAHADWVRRYVGRGE